MDQKSLNAFLILAEELQFSRAAKRLDITQSALSQQIARLESELGVALFERTKRMVKLSESGSVFRHDAKNVIFEMEKAADTARRAANGLLGKLVIAYVDAAPFSLLSPILMQFRRHYPDVHLVLEEMSSAEQYNALQGGQIDIGLLRPLNGIEQVPSVTLLREPYVIAMPRDHALAEFHDVHIRQLIKEKFLFTSFEKARYIFSNLEPIFKHHGMVPDIVQEVNQLHALLSLVGAGMGLAFLPLSVAMNNNHGVVFKNITGADIPPVELNISWCNQKNEKLIGNFVKMARSAALRFGQAASGGK